MTSKDPELEYLAGLRRLPGEEAPFDPVKQVIRARLAGACEPVQGLVSPPHGWDDPDTSLLLLYLYDQLRFDQDGPAKERLRRAVVELLEEALNSGAGFQAIDCLWANWSAPSRSVARICWRAGCAPGSGAISRSTCRGRARH